MLVDDDSILHLQTGPGGQLVIRGGCQSRHNAIYFESSAAPVWAVNWPPICSAFINLSQFAISTPSGDNSRSGIEIDCMENMCANCLLWKDHGDFFAGHRQCRGISEPIKPPPDHKETFTILSQCASPALVVSEFDSR